MSDKRMIPGTTLAQSCAGKEAYASSSLAHKVLKRRLKRGPRKATYHCPFCGAWHIGGEPRTVHQKSVGDNRMRAKAHGKTPRCRETVE